MIAYGGDSENHQNTVTVCPGDKQKCVGRCQLSLEGNASNVFTVKHS